MKAMWFLPFTYAAGAEGFALFVPYLVCLLGALYFLRAYRHALRTAPVPVAANRPQQLDVLLDVQPAL